MSRVSKRWGGGGSVLLYIGLSICPHVASSQWDKSPVRIRLFLYIYGLHRVCHQPPNTVEGILHQKALPNAATPRTILYTISFLHLFCVTVCEKKRKQQIQEVYAQKKKAIHLLFDDVFLSII